MRPSWFLEIPSSSSAQSMPSLKTPRTLRFSIVNPAGSVVPSGANGYFPPTATFGAPHTTVISAGPPKFTLHSVSLSAFGCFSMASTSATTTPGTPPPRRSMPSTSTPENVSLSANPSTVSSKSTYSFSQLNGIFMVNPSRCQTSEVRLDTEFRLFSLNSALRPLTSQNCAKYRTSFS